MTQGKKKSPVDCVDFDITCMQDEEHGFLVRQVQPCTSWDGAVFASRVNDGPLLLFVCAQALNLQLFLCGNFLLSLFLSPSLSAHPQGSQLSIRDIKHIERGKSRPNPKVRLQRHTPPSVCGECVFSTPQLF